MPGTREGDTPPWMKIPDPPSPVLSRESLPGLRPYSEQRASSVLAIVATLNLEVVLRHPPRSLPPWIGASIGILGDIDWPTVCQLAIREQNTALEGASELPAALVRDQPWQLRDFLEGSGLIIPS